jgi:integrase/recombinase XerD
MKHLSINWALPSTTDFRSALQRYRLYLQDCGLRKSTIEEYKGNVGRYLKFCGTDHPTPKDFDKFRESLHSWKLSRSTLNQYGYSIKSYHKMIGDELTIQRLNPDNKIPYYFTEKEVERIFQACMNLKHKAMLSVLFYGALRATELCQLDDSDINLSNLTLRIQYGKGGCEGITCINENCASLLRHYLKVRPPFLIDGRQPLFYTDYGQRWSRTELHRIFTIYKKKAGVESKGCVHVFARHTPATLLISRGCDLKTVQELLRHRDLRTTSRYVHISDTVRRQKYDQFLGSYH